MLTENQEAPAKIAALENRIASLEKTIATLINELVRGEKIYPPTYGHCKRCFKREEGITENTGYCDECCDIISRLPVRKPAKCSRKECDRESMSMLDGLCSAHYELEAKYDPFEHCDSCLSKRGVLQSLEPIIGSGANEMGCPICHPEWFPCGPEETPENGAEEGGGDGD